MRDAEPDQVADRKLAGGHGEGEVLVPERDGLHAGGGQGCVAGAGPVTP